MKKSPDKVILVSACLLGTNCKYNGGNNMTGDLIKLLEGHKIIAICPETAGGLSTPRTPAEIINGDGHDVLNKQARVENKLGEDVTDGFIKGSKLVIAGIEPTVIDFAILKERSPSCGSNFIYSGDFTGRVKPGMGVASALLNKLGIEVFSEEELDKIRIKLTQKA